jgi:carotenoid cleavage dioxygenase
MIDASGKKLPSIAIDCNEPRMVHDFAITEHYAIFLDLPLVFNKKNLFSEKGFFEFRKDGVSRIGILPRYDKDISNMRWFPVDPCYVFHTANAFEEGRIKRLLPVSSSITSPP